MKWWRKIIENRRPAFFTEIGMTWPLWCTRWFGIALSLRYRSDSTFDQVTECNRLVFVLEGVQLEHRELPRYGRHQPAQRVPKGAYTYVDEQGLWLSQERRAGALFAQREGRRGGIELPAPANAGDRIIDFPEWMRTTEVVFDGEGQVIVLMLVWGGVWR